MFMPSGHPANINAFEPYPLYIQKGKGPYVYTHEGHELIDVVNGYSTFIHGHNQEEILDIIMPELKKGFFFCSPTEAQLEFSRLLIERVPYLDKIRVTNSGTEATMHALRTARAYTNRSKIVKFFGSYHGSHDCVLASPLKNPLSEGLPLHTVDDVLEVEYNDFEQVQRMFEQQGNEIAALIVEPCIGGGGSISPKPGFLQHLRDLCTRYGSILIFDEIVTFRLHEGGAQSYYGVKADLVTYGKIIGAGFPIGVFGGKAELMNIYDYKSRTPLLPHGGTFFGYQAAMLAGIYALKHLPQKTIESLNNLGDYFSKKLQEVVDRKKLHVEINLMGSILTMHYTPSKVTNFSEALTSNKELAKVIHLAFLNKGIFTAVQGKYYILSTCMDKKMIDQIVNTYEEILNDIYPYIQKNHSLLIKDA